MAAQATNSHHLRQQSSSSLSLPQGSYIYSLCRNGDGALAVISSDDSLRSFDRQTLQLLPDGVIADTHSSSQGGVTCLCEVGAGNAGRDGLMATAGRDGFVKLWDSRTARSDPVASFSTGTSRSIGACLLVYPITLRLYLVLVYLPSVCCCIWTTLHGISASRGMCEAEIISLSCLMGLKGLGR